MSKENENIHIFIIEEDYRRSKTRLNTQDTFLTKPESLILDKHRNESLFLELKNMHSFEVNQETLQASEGTKQIDPLQIVGSSKSINDLDNLASLQKMKTEEQKLIKQKSLLLLTEQDLHCKHNKEMDKEKTAINNLKAEILDLILSSSPNSNGITVNITVTL